VAFCDVTEIYVKAGDGGNGRLSFLHEKYREFGGPDGGDGGDGGSVIFKVDPGWNTLYFYKTHKKLVAQDGEVGKARKKHGRNADDLYIHVPVGTSIYDAQTNELLITQRALYFIPAAEIGGFLCSKMKPTPFFLIKMSRLPISKPVLKFVFL
jgi:Obg family GTPase CgtA